MLTLRARLACQSPTRSGLAIELHQEPREATGSEGHRGLRVDTRDG